MYLRAVHAESHLPTLRQLIRSFPLGVFTTAVPSAKYPLLQSSHIPFLLDVQDEASETELGVLRGHMARANPQTKAMIDALTATSPPSDSDSSNPGRASRVLEQEVLVLFTSPVEHYVTPKFYVETKPATGKVVPTWNYAAVQAYGRARVYFDAKADETAAFLDTALADLSRYSETRIMGYDGADGKPRPWEAADAPASYVGLLKKAIVGIEIRVERLEGKFKMNQELSEGDRQGVVDGFRALETEIGDKVAELVKLRGEMKTSK